MSDNSSSKIFENFLPFIFYIKFSKTLKFAAGFDYD